MNDEIQADAEPPEPATGRTPDPVIHEEIAPHLDPAEVQDRRVLLHESMRLPGRPHYLTSFDQGVHELSEDVLADFLPGQEISALGRRRVALQNTARQASFMLSALDPILLEARTGHLIRLVLHTEAGALIGCSVTPGQRNVVGIVYEAVAGLQPNLTTWPRVREADRTVSSLAEELRKSIGMPAQNIGGWQTVMPENPSETASSTDDQPSGPVTSIGAGSAELMNACRDELHPQGLIYLAYHRGDEKTFALDILEDPRALKIWGRSAVGIRRHFYGRLYPQLESLSSQFGQLVRPALRGRLMRIVLDVEQGAVYYNRLAPREYLFGVTLNQSRVRAADEQMARLTLRCTGLWG